MRVQLIGQDIAENSSNLSGELLSPDFQEDAEASYYDVDLRDEPAPSWVDYQRPLPPQSLNLFKPQPGEVRAEVLQPLYHARPRGVPSLVHSANRPKSFRKEFGSCCILVQVI